MQNSENFEFLFSYPRCYLHVIYMLFTRYLHVIYMLFTCYLHVIYMLFLLSAEIESVMVSVIMESVIMESVSYAIITLNAYSE